jgi:hypothetical protein
MGAQLGKILKIIKVIGATVAGQTEINGTAVDLSGYEGVMFVAHFGAITVNGVQSLSADQGATQGSATDAIAGSKVVVADDDDEKVAVLDIYRPRDRWVRPVIARATADSIVNGCVAYLYGPKKAPPAKDASVAAQKELQSPAEGAI